MRSITVDVDIDISTVLETLSDEEWVDILRETDDATLAKAGLQRIPGPQIDSLAEHLTLVRGTHSASGDTFHDFVRNAKDLEQPQAEPEWVVVSDEHSNHNLPIGAHVTYLRHDDDNTVDYYTQGGDDDEVAIDPRDLRKGADQ